MLLHREWQFWVMCKRLKFLKRKHVMRKRFFLANIFICGFWPPWPHFRRKSDEAGSSRDFHAISRLKGAPSSYILYGFQTRKRNYFCHMQSLKGSNLTTCNVKTLQTDCLAGKCHGRGYLDFFHLKKIRVPNICTTKYNLLVIIGSWYTDFICPNILKSFNYLPYPRH